MGRIERSGLRIVQRSNPNPETNRRSTFWLNLACDGCVFRRNNEYGLRCEKLTPAEIVNAYSGGGCSHAAVPVPYSDNIVAQGKMSSAGKFTPNGKKILLETDIKVFWNSRN